MSNLWIPTVVFCILQQTNRPTLPPTASSLPETDFLLVQLPWCRQFGSWRPGWSICRCEHPSHAVYPFSEANGLFQFPILKVQNLDGTALGQLT